MRPRCGLQAVAVSSSTRDQTACDQNCIRNSAVIVGVLPKVQNCMHHQPASLQKVHHVPPEAKEMCEKHSIYISITSTCRQVLLLLQSQHVQTYQLWLGGLSDKEQCTCSVVHVTRSGSRISKSQAKPRALHTPACSESIFLEKGKVADCVGLVFPCRSSYTLLHVSVCNVFTR